MPTVNAGSRASDIIIDGNVIQTNWDYMILVRESFKDPKRFFEICDQIKHLRHGLYNLLYLFVYMGGTEEFILCGALLQWYMRKNNLVNEDIDKCLEVNFFK